MRVRRKLWSAQIRPCERNGHCFFEAIASCIGSTPAHIRQGCCHAFEALDADSRTVMALGEANGTVEEYLLRLSTTLFGGHNEMILAANHFRITIHLYKRTRNATIFTRSLSVVPNETTDPSSTAHILWDGIDHYDALQDVVRMVSSLHAERERR